MPEKRIACLGLSHRRAPLVIRERLTCTPLAVRDVLRPTPHDSGGAVNECVLLKTCNRVELYGYVDATSADARTLLVDLLERATGQSLADLNDHFYHYVGVDAAEHLCRVATGLDSLVLGEQQILGQVADALQEAVTLQTVGDYLSSVFRAAIRAGRKARTHTGISANSVSVSSVALSQAQERVGDLAKSRILVIGAGQMGHLSLKALRARKLSNVTVANRTESRAALLADRYGCASRSLGDLAAALASTDVVISATSADSPILTEELVRDAMRTRGEEELVLVDIAVPRDVDPAVSEIPHVHLIDMDTLRSTLDRALQMRRREVPRVEEIIDHEIGSLRHDLHEISVRPLITDLRQKAESIRLRELDRTLRHIGDLDPQAIERIHHLSRSLVNKLLHEPTVRIREQAANGGGVRYASTVRSLFGLSKDPKRSV